MNHYTKPTPSELSNWYAERCDATYTCACGTTGSGHHVQPQHPYFAGGRENVARCAACIAKENEAARRARKAELDAMPRCAMCRRRATLLVGSENTPMCKAHHSAASRAASLQMGPVFTGMPIASTREALIAYAKAGAR